MKFALAIAGKFVPDIFNRLYPYSRPALPVFPPFMAVKCKIRGIDEWSLMYRDKMGRHDAGQ